MGWFSDVLKFEKSHLKSLWKGIKDDPKRLILGVDPLSTKMWNEVLGRNDRALVNQLGGATSYDYQRALDEGINIGPGQTMQNVAGMIAGTMAGGALSGIGAAAPAAGTAAGTAGGAAGAATAGGLTAAIPGGSLLAAGMASPGAAYTAAVGAGAQAIGEEVPGVSDPLELEEIRLTRPSLRVPGVPTLAKGGYASEAQARLMRARAHGWSPKKPRKKLPSRAVAEEFVEAKDRKYSGGFAENRYAKGGAVTANLEGQLRDITGRSSTAEETRQEVKDRARFEAMSAPQRIQLLGPQLRKAEVIMDEIGKAEFGTKYSLRDYTKMENNLRQLREQYGRASQEQKGFYQGGLATMNMQEGGDVYTPYGPGEDYGDLTPDQIEFLSWDTSGGGIYNAQFRKLQAKMRAKYGLSDPATDETVTAPPVVAQPPGGGGFGFPGGPPGWGGGWSPPPGWVPPGGLPPGGGPPLPGGPPPPTDVIPYVPPPPRDPRAGRDTEYSAALRAHRERIAASLSVPEGGYAEGGHVNYYQEGGAARAGHAEGANPYPEESARYKLWERKNHRDPAPPPVAAAPEAEDISWLDRLLRGEKGRQTRTERELEEMGEAHGGRVHYPRGYQYGGLAMAAPRGGRPPWIEPAPGYQFGGAAMPYRGIPGGMSRQFPARGGPGGPGGAYGIPGGGMPPSRIPGGGGMPGGGGFPGGGGLAAMMRQAQGMRGRLPGGGGGVPGGPGGSPWTPGRGFPGGPPIGPPGGGPGGFQFPPGKGPRPMVPPSPPGGFPGGGGRPGEGGGIPGGPRVPPNMRGYLQRQRMMNRPPANVGGGANRVGMQDQQGGMARALQRGTGRPPMSRRAGFPGRSIR